MARRRAPGQGVRPGDARGLRAGWSPESWQLNLATTEAFLDNAASAGVSRSLGYLENGHGSLAPEGVARETQRFRMTLEEWRSRSRSGVRFDDLDACLGMFGAHG